jgi:hypothetical protein
MQFEGGNADLFQGGELDPRAGDQAVRRRLQLGFDLVIVNPQARSLGGRGGQCQRRYADKRAQNAPPGR